MPQFVITGPDGQKYKVTGDNAEGALAALKGHLGDTGSPSVGADAAKGFGSGVVQGTIGLGTMAGDIASMARNKVLEWGGVTPDQIQAIEGVQSGFGIGIPNGNAATTKKVEEVTGPLYQAQTIPGQYAQTVGQFVPGMAMGPGSMGQRITSGVSAALGSETAGQATKGSAAEPYARLGGALLGGVLPDVARRAVTPFPVAQERQALLGNLADEGVDLTAGQKTGSKPLQYLEAELGGGKAADVMDRQAEQFTAAAARKAGIEANRLTPEVMDKAFTDVGNKFDGLIAKTAVPMDAKMQDDLLNAVINYQAIDALPASAAEGLMNRISALASKNGSVLDGKAYKEISSDIARYSRSSSDPALISALRDIKSSLDDAVERGLSGATLDEWKAARSQYRNLLVLEKGMSGAGGAEGLISPQKLRSSTVQVQGSRNYVRGNGDFADLARSGDAVMKPLPNSGTAGRIKAQQLGAGMTALLGSLAGSGGGMPGMVAGGLLGMGAPVAAGKALMSKPVQAYLANQLIASQGLPAAQKAIIPLLGVAPRITGPR